MRIIRFTVRQAGQVIGHTPIREQAVGAAKARARQTGLPVSALALWDTGKEQDVLFYPDGSYERISK